MLKSKLGKRLAASTAALAMAVSASASSLAALTAHAGMLLGEGTFNDGAGLPWHICESATGKMQFSVVDGVYAIKIENPGGASNGGEDRWDCQFRHRGLSLEWGHVYRITYSIYASNSGKTYAKIGDLNNNDLEYWHSCGNKLDMKYDPNLSLDELVSQLKSAKSSKGEPTDSANSSDWDVPYYEGWNTWKNETIPAKTWTTYAYEFLLSKKFIENTTPPDKVDGSAEWTFHLGGDGSFTDAPMFPEGTILRFDNMALVDMSGDEHDYKADEAKEAKGLVVNQLGYFPNRAKKATVVVTEGAAPQSFTITGADTMSGTTSATMYDEGAWEYCQTIDFSDLTTPGKYTLTVGDKSVDFVIGEDIYKGQHGGTLLADSLNYFYLNRSGIAIEEAYIQNPGQNASKKDLTRKAGHDPDLAYVTDEWVFAYTEQTNKEIEARYSGNEKRDVTGGWYDAGDYGKYVVNGGVSMWTLANTYEMSPDKFAVGADFINIPESSNNIPDILDEIAWEADFFEKMQRDDGMVYHKMHDYKWTGLGVMPYSTATGEDAEKLDNTNMPTRIIKPVTYAATLNTAGALAQLSRLIKPYDATKAAHYLEVAEKAYKAAKSAFTKNYGDIYADAASKASSDDMFAPLDQNVGGGPYGDTQVSDEFYWAACELFITTEGKTAEYAEDMRAYKEAFYVTTNLVGGENQGSPTSFTWGTLAALGTASLALHQDLLTADEAKKVVQSFQEAGDFYLEKEAESAYGTPYPGHSYDATVVDFDLSSDSTSERTIHLDGGYEWGSNSMVINNAIILGTAYNVTGNVKYLDGATTAMDYIFGRNAMENSYVTGYGTSTTENPHHRFWNHQMKVDWPWCPDGCLSGGPNSNMNDPMIKGAGYKIGELAPMKCYLDLNDAWSVNEITINWNSPVVWMASFAEDYANDAAGEHDTTPTSSSSEDGDILYGDTDCNGKVELLDVILLNKNLLGMEKLSDKGAKNADVNIDTAVDGTDSLYILKSLVSLVTLPVKS